jgi:hypothetical protein
MQFSKEKQKTIEKIKTLSALVIFLVKLKIVSMKIVSNMNYTEFVHRMRTK